ncbi:unnamed protein product [Rotaria sp. Silwood2]|nr:unnamed protein product [Rotaria sp. Silwood2]CAF2889390.1 unnamed protein product [Rotaria sp. Silwood2]CAF3135891.1 unnamed protein product [Rotaria sp. Silwood2]CAF3273973.1 unnamed protein product [Rotaria sp. Silwood2]CAF4065725.1 unnamed protein product [Rotaria sp. Silwood2]
MAKRYKQSSSLLTRCIRSNKTISTSVPTSNSHIKTSTHMSNTCLLSSVVEAIQTIDQMVQSVKITNDKQQGDSGCLEKTMNIEQIEEMLTKWTHIAHFLMDTYEQMQTFNEYTQKFVKVEKLN